VLHGPVCRADIERRFGEEVAALVAAMTEDSRIGAYADRKAGLRRQIAGNADAFGRRPPQTAPLAVRAS
jgi:(p)ppGpp synthase/HD superfamily hydrolase